MMFALAMIAIIASFFISVDSFLRAVLKFGLLGGGVYLFITSSISAIQSIIPAAPTF